MEVIGLALLPAMVRFLRCRGKQRVTVVTYPKTALPKLVKRNAAKVRFRHKEKNVCDGRPQIAGHRSPYRCCIGGTMLTGYLERFLTSRKARGVVPRSIHWYQVNLRVYLDWLALYPDLKWDDAETIDLFFADQRATGLKDNTILGRYRSLSIWFSWLRRRKFIVESPMEMIDAPTVKRVPIKHMTLAEYEQLIRSIAGESWIDKRDRCLIYVIFWCGLRISEACNLRQSDIDIAAKTVKVERGKGGDGRLVPCGDDLYPMVLDYVWNRPPTELDWIFLGSNGGGGVRGKFTPGGAAIMMKRRCQDAGMRAISPHKGRHGLAMELLNAGLDMSAVSKVLGHSNQKTTADFYAKWLTGPLVRQYTEVRDHLLTPKSPK